MNTKIKSIFFAISAAVFYALNIPLSKILLKNINPSFMAALLYLGAGFGMMVLALINRDSMRHSDMLTKKDLPFVIGMIVLDIAAPIFMMTGINYGTSSNASLLGNFEIAATTIIAMYVFHESVSKRLWLALILITLSGIILTFESEESFTFSYGSLFVLMAASCWGLENNCTRKISSKNAYEIVILKGIFSGTGSMMIALFSGENIPGVCDSLYALALGFVAYGLSIFFYVKAQNILGAAKTSAYYAAAPFIGVLFSFVILHEKISVNFIAALIIMIAGSVLVVIDTLILSHSHEHTHIITHTHGGTKHTHIITHSHMHNHYVSSEAHRHNH
ncbi:MAG: DMT family transporter [Synergistaceae bacterium]|nr:DMT family transporter [Synergistaceae bacterium]MBQ3449253.1 DMT family transporter [Synergistaceae bacterium]MBQ3694042.1 DMT family transporter [Synergistaceae bacterium]